MTTRQTPFMPKRTNPFQQLSASIMATINGLDYLVDESVIEVNKKTGLPREIDIRIINRKDPSDKTLVECRDHNRKQDVTWIDALDGKSRSLGIKKVVAISSSGFYKTAEKEARSRDIETLHIREAEALDWQKWLFSIKEFGLNIDHEPIVKLVNLVTPPGIETPELNNALIQEIFLVDLNQKKKIALSEYIKGLVKDPKIIEHIRANNVEGAITHYDCEIPCDPGIGYYVASDERFIPLIKIIFSLESMQSSYKIPLKHMRAGDRKILVGDQQIRGHNTQLVLEEKDGTLTVMIEEKFPT